MLDWPHQSKVDEFYGNPRSEDGGASAKWEQEHLVLAKTPWQLVTAWDGGIVKGVRVHEKCAESLTRVFDAIWLAADRNEQKIREWGMHLYGGGYIFRLMKGGTRLSMHSWGCAVDFDPARNAFGDTTPNFENYPDVLEAFEKEGWTWGGKWKKPDGMHWQAARV